MSNLLQPHEADWYEASARERVAGLLDPGSFTEFLGPEQRAMSPHLAQFDLTGAFDERDQNIESAAAEAQRLPVIEQHPLRGDQLERPEDEALVIHGGAS